MEIILGIIAIGFIIWIFEGIIKTFKRSLILAILLMFFATPIWACWAFVEMFTGDVK